MDLADHCPDWSRTFVAVKPDSLNRALVGDVIQRLEKRGYKLLGLKMLQPSEMTLREHYKDLSTRPYFDPLIRFMLRGPLIAMVWEGVDIVKQVRQMLGVTDPLQSNPGTIRGDHCIFARFNAVHASDSDEAAAREIASKPPGVPRQLELFKSVCEQDLINCTQTIDDLVFQASSSYSD